MLVTVIGTMTLPAATNDSVWLFTVVLRA